MGLPTIVGAFSRFSGSATIRVCWKQEMSGLKTRYLKCKCAHCLKQNTCYLSRIRHIIVVMVNDSSLLLIKFNATLAAQLPQRVTCVKQEKGMNLWTYSSILEDRKLKQNLLRNQLTNIWTGSNQDIASTINERCNSLHINISSKVCRWPKRMMFQIILTSQTDAIKIIVKFTISLL